MNKTEKEMHKNLVTILTGALQYLLMNNEGVVVEADNILYIVCKKNDRITILPASHCTQKTGNDDILMKVKAKDPSLYHMLIKKSQELKSWYKSICTSN